MRDKGHIIIPLSGPNKCPDNYSLPPFHFCKIREPCAHLTQYCEVLLALEH